MVSEILYDAILILIGKAPFFWGACALVPLVYIAAGALLHEAAAKQRTVLNELQTLGKSRVGKLSGAAVVAGGSWSGLMAARVLSDHFEEVIVVEPDSELHNKRTTVSQWDQHHSFSPIVLSVLRKLFAKFDDTLTAAGLSVGAKDPCLVLDGRALRAPEDQLASTIHGSRMGLESTIRQLVLKTLPNVKFLRGEIQSVTPSADITRLASAQLLTSSGETQTLPLSFLADCTGPASAGASWLARASDAWSAVPRATYDPRVTYASATIPVAPGAALRLGAKTCGPIRTVHTAEGKQYTVTRIEGDRLLLTAAQRGGDPSSLPRSLDDFRAWCSAAERASAGPGVPPAALADTLAATTDAGPDAWSRVSVAGGAYHLRYDAARALPANFVALGDAVARLDPLFGQGCAVGAVGAAVLDGQLRAAAVAPGVGRLPDGFGTEVAREVAGRVKPVFDVTRWIDYGYPETQVMEGETREAGKFARAYLRALLSVVNEDDNAAARYWAVTGGVAAPTALLHPRMLAKVLWRAVGIYRGTPKTK